MGGRHLRYHGHIRNYQCNQHQLNLLLHLHYAHHHCNDDRGEYRYSADYSNLDYLVDGTGYHREPNRDPNCDHLHHHYPGCEHRHEHKHGNDDDLHDT